MSKVKGRERHTVPSRAAGCALLVGLLATGACGTEASEGNEEPLTQSPSGGPSSESAAPRGQGLDALDPNVAALVSAYCQTIVDCVGSGVPEAESCADTFAARLDFCPEETLSFLNCGVAESVECKCSDEACISFARACSTNDLNTCLNARQPFAVTEDGMTDSSGIACCMCAPRELREGGSIRSEEQCWCYTAAVLEQEGAEDCNDMRDTQSVCNWASCREEAHFFALGRQERGVAITYVGTQE